jgi:hypothetical protein
MKRRTLRGQIPEGVIQRLIVDDGRLNHGYKITKFTVAGDGNLSAGNDVTAVLGLNYDTPPTWNWGDNRQIAWSSTNIDGLAGLNAPFSVVDPDHIVIQDLWIQGQTGSGGGTGVINYLIELEPMELTDDQAILQLIKERSQDDLR